MLQINYINLLNNIILSSNSPPINSLEVLSNQSYLYSLIKEILPNFEHNSLNASSEETINNTNNNFISLLTSIEKYSSESNIKENFTNETQFSKTISVENLINNDINELIKIAEMLIFLTMLSSNKTNYIEKINQIEDNQLSKLYYAIIEKYICIRIDKTAIINNNILINQKFDSKELSIQNQENFVIKNDKEIGINKLQKENDELNKIINKLSLEKKELEKIIEKNGVRIKQIKLENEKLKNEYDKKEQNTAEIISNNKSMIEKLNHDLKIEIKENKKLNEEKEVLINELNKYKESDIQKIKEKNSLHEKDEEELNFYKKSYEEQKMRVNEEHKLISESLYKLAVHFMTLKDDLQNRINLAKNNK